MIQVDVRMTESQKASILVERSKGIASRLAIHEGRVRKHIERLYPAMGGDRRVELSSLLRI